jgi:hypothetical protein
LVIVSILQALSPAHLPHPAPTCAPPSRGMLPLPLPHGSVSAHLRGLVPLLLATSEHLSHLYQHH